jgi:MoaA/NifB/PqqE/SkfB family radical SAM enzyme
MTEEIFQKLFKRPRKRTFSTWQIELTTRCPLKCRMCVREGFEDWQSGDMSFDNFKRLVPYFKDVERVVLEGWGESLLHKNLIDIVELVKEKGPEVGFVTSGKGLNESYICELIDAGVDFIGFSLSGATAETHNAIRVNSDFQTLLKDIRSFSENKMKRNQKKTKVAYCISYAKGQYPRGSFPDGSFNRDPY